MQEATAVAVVPQRAVRSSVLIVGLILAFLASAMLGLAGTTRAASVTASAPATTSDAPAQLKAVIIVGPTHGHTASFLERGEALAKSAESYGMDVRRVFHPRATAARVLANIQGAHIVAYIGHGNGWPSPYGPYQERTKNGFGLNPFEGGSTSNVEYYGGNWIRNNVVLAPNAVTLLNGLCYAAGNGESGMAIPSWDIARQRVDNFAAAFLAVGSKGVFAYSWQPGSAVIKQLFTTNKTFGQIFETTGAAAHPSYGFIGWDARKFNSVRTPGATNYLDPHSREGFLRAFSGDLNVTAGTWATGAAPDPGEGDGTPDPVEPPPDEPVDTTAPSVPQNLTTEALGYRRVSLKWDASTDDSGGALKYKVMRNGVVVATVSKTSYVDRPASAGTYKYKVRAVDPSRNRSPWSPVVLGQAVKGELGTPLDSADTTPPSVPTGLAAKAKDSRYVQLTWQPSTDDRAGTLRYRIFRNGSLLVTVTTTSFLDRAPAVGEYRYKVRAIDAANNKSAFSPVALVTAVKAV